MLGTVYANIDLLALFFIGLLSILYVVSNSGYSKLLHILSVLSIVVVLIILYLILMAITSLNYTEIISFKHYINLGMYYVLLIMGISIICTIVFDRLDNEYYIKITDIVFNITVIVMVVLVILYAMVDTLYN